MTTPTPATVAALLADNSRLRTEALRVAAATTHALPADLAALLTGETEADLTRQASALARFAGSAAAPPPAPGGGMPAKPRTALAVSIPERPFDAREVADRVNSRTY